MRCVISVLLGILMSFMSFDFACAAAPEVTSIVKQMKDMMEPEQSSRQKLTITLTAEGDNTQWIAGKLYKPLKDGKGIVIVMLEPQEVRGIAFLVRERKNKPDLMWIYVPFIRRVRELLPVNAYEPFIGTDFTFADLGFVDINRHYKLIGEKQHSGVKAFEVQGSPGQADKFFDSRIVTWIAAGTLLPIERDYYDPAGQLWKTELFKDVSVVDGVSTPMRIEMKVMNGGNTTINVDTIDNKADIPDEVFDPKNLSKLGSHPIWQPFTQKPGEGK